MTTVDPKIYYAVAKMLFKASLNLEEDLRVLDRQLDVSRSAGLYPYGGPLWGQSFDQSASDAFEAGSNAAMASRELGKQIHTAGQNLVHAENESHPGPHDPIPDSPRGTSLASSLHPTKMSVGATEGDPDHWPLVEEYVTRKWADCDEARIATAGVSLTNYGSKVSTFANKLYLDIKAAFPEEARNGDPVLAGYISDTADVCRAIAASADAANYLGIACKQVSDTAGLAKKDCRTSLTLLAGIVASYEADKVAAKILPNGRVLTAQLDNLIRSNKMIYAESISGRLGDIETKVADAVKSNNAIYALVSGETKGLSAILGRTPRSTRHVGNRDVRQNNEAGREGERRAGVDPDAPKRQVTVIDRDGNPNIAIPDRIDDSNRQVTEVKNTNEIGPYKEQILIEEQWARDNGYTLTLVVDHRTQINDPDIQGMIDTGQITLIRKELDDNNDP
ncbi:putative toxin [Nocardia amikacinitolerans]|uniref:putative toxin n=1 Tax=Nocardia amikacinitolerans TaxID=756689 RepID=UPI0036BE2F93